MRLGDEMPERIGILGGTFDPVHVGHVVAAVDARYNLSLDQVLLVVANQPWQKVGVREVTPAYMRLEMAGAAVEGIEGVRASDIEIKRSGSSYTSDTVAELRWAHPGAELYLIVGQDVAASMATWERFEELVDQVVVAVIPRPGATMPAAMVSNSEPQVSVVFNSEPQVGAVANDILPQGHPWRSVLVEIPLIEVSSSEVRDRVAQGRPIDGLVPAAVISCIRRYGLYS